MWDIATRMRPIREKRLPRKNQPIVNSPMIPPARPRPHNFLLSANTPPNNGNSDRIIPMAPQISKMSAMNSPPTGTTEEASVAIAAINAQFVREIIPAIRSIAPPTIGIKVC